MEDWSNSLEAMWLWKQLVSFSLPFLCENVLLSCENETDPILSDLSNKSYQVSQHMVSLLSVQFLRLAVLKTKRGEE